MKNIDTRFPVTPEETRGLRLFGVYSGKGRHGHKTISLLTEGSWVINGNWEIKWLGLDMRRGVSPKNPACSFFYICHVTPEFNALAKGEYNAIIGEAQQSLNEGRIEGIPGLHNLKIKTNNVKKYSDDMWSQEDETLLAIQNEGALFSIIHPVIEDGFSVVLNSLMGKTSRYIRENLILSPECRESMLYDSEFREKVLKGLIKYYLQDPLIDAANMPQNTTTTKEDKTMPKVTGKIVDKRTYVEDEDITDMTEEQLVAKMTDLQNRITAIEKMPKSTRMTKKAALYQVGIDTLVAELDGRPDPE